MSLNIDIDPKTQERIASIAALRGISLEAAAADMLREQAEATECYEREKAEDMAAIKHYRATGECVSREDMHTKMNSIRQTIRARANNNS